MSTWPVLDDRGLVADLHRRSSERLAAMGAPGSRLVVVHHPEAAAVVLGSTQDAALVDREACSVAGVEVARRRSGGGAVLVEAASLIWVDLFVPEGDPLWRRDVGQAAWWVGEAWAAALDAAGWGRAEVWRGPLRSSAWSPMVCFAGLGAGEVTIGDRKVVGIAQRRVRAGALFQTACLLTWQPERLVALFKLTDEERLQCLAAVQSAAMGLGTGRSSALLESFLGSLPTARKPTT